MTDMKNSHSESYAAAGVDVTAGYESVDAHFLRIEHAAADNSRDPQIVPYHFEKTDLPALEALIIAKQHEAVV